MEEKNVKKNLYQRCCDFLSVKWLAWASVGVFVLLMLPICYLSFVNRASGDDYGYGVYTRTAWVSSHSLIEVLKASIQTIRSYYYSWQGTWFSIFVFSLQPEVFSRHAYVITTFLMLFLLVGSTFLLFNYILQKKLHFDRWSVLIITLLYLMLTIELIPGIKSALVWYNGMAHYMLPFVMCQFLGLWLIQYMDTHRKRYFAGVTIFMILLGGSNYQAALFALIAAFYAGVFIWFSRKTRKWYDRGIILAIPMLLEAVGLAISMKAPGNNIRAGGELGFSVSKGLTTIAMSFVQGILDIVRYMKEKPIMWIGLLALFLILLEAFMNQEQEYHIKYPIFIVIGLYCLYSAMQAPAIYADVEVSRGVYNTNYQVFLLMMLGILSVLAEKTVRKIKSGWHKKELKENQAEQDMDIKAWVHSMVVLPGLCILVVFLVLCKGNVKQTTSYICLSYITSGQAADFKEQMDLQTDLLMEENVSDVVVPFINDDQGPLMHMPVTADPEAWTNTVTREFYGKESVVAIPREEWMEKYGRENE